MTLQLIRPTSNMAASLSPKIRIAALLLALALLSPSAVAQSCNVQVPANHLTATGTLLLQYPAFLPIKCPITRAGNPLHSVRQYVHNGERGDTGLRRSPHFRSCLRKSFHLPPTHNNNGHNSSHHPHGAHPSTQRGCGPVVWVQRSQADTDQHRWDISSTRRLREWSRGGGYPMLGPTQPRLCVRHSNVHTQDSCILQEENFQKALAVMAASAENTGTGFIFLMALSCASLSRRHDSCAYIIPRPHCTPRHPPVAVSPMSPPSPSRRCSASP